MSKWKEVTRGNPCPACKHNGWCAWTADGWLKCERSAVAPAGMVLARRMDGGALFRPDDGRARASAPIHLVERKPSAVSLEFAALQTRFQVGLSTEQRDALAATLGVRPDALVAIGVGWAARADLRELRASGAGWTENPPEGAFTFPERDGHGRIVGFSLRTTDGRKGAPSGSVGARRGLIVPATLAQRPDPVLIVEGASDVAACETMGLAAVGRPSNSGGAHELAALLESRAVIVVGENDGKDSGGWPGRDGAKGVARALAAVWDEPQRWALPPRDGKDIRSWLGARVAAGLDLADATACANAGRELQAALTASARAEKASGKPSQAEALVRLALERYRIGVSENDEPFAVPLAGPNVALMFRGSRDALRSALSRDYRRCFNATPSASALADALMALQGEAQERAPEPVYLRIATDGDGIVLDLGNADGTAVRIGPRGWEVRQNSPVLFRRTALTGTLPVPERGGDIAELRALLNVTEDSWPIVLGWLVAAFLPDMPHPILMLGGEQGAGKTTAARFLAGLVDPSPAPLRSPPRDLEQWALGAAGSWIVAVDNVSGIPQWWSDCLCKAVTGDGWVARRLYTDGDLAVVNFRRVVALTSIDAGALRGDLGDRLILADLEPIDERSRRTEHDLDGRYFELRPRLLGALLDLVAAVLARLPHVRTPALPRMADFARVLAALDEVLPGLGAFQAYLAQRERIAGDVLEADPVGAAILALVPETGGPWSGTAGDLLKAIAPEPPGRDWPHSPRALAARLKRLTPALRAAGIEVSQHRRAGGSRERLLTFSRNGAHPTVPTVPPEGAGPHDGNGQNTPAGTNTGRLPPDEAEDRPGLRPAPNTRLDGVGSHKAPGSDARDGRDDCGRDPSPGCIDGELPPDYVRFTDPAAEDAADGNGGER